MSHITSGQHPVNWRSEESAEHTTSNKCVISHETDFPFVNMPKIDSTEKRVAKNEENNIQLRAALTWVEVVAVRQANTIARSVEVVNAALTPGPAGRIRGVARHAGVWITSVSTGGDIKRG